MKLTLTLILLSLMAISCSKGGSSSARKKIKLTPEMMDALLAQQDLSCPSGDCPDAVARLFVINFEDAANSSNCTGTLVGDRLLLTNSHCVNIGTQEKACEGFYAVFKTKAWGHEVARCTKIIFRDNHYSRNRQDLSNRDYALIELDRVIHAKPLEIERNGFDAGDTVHPYVIDHIDAFDARIVKLNCKVSSESSNGRDNVLENCPAIPGNSGSAIFNKAGKVAGVLYAAQDTAVDETTPYETRIAAPTISLGFSMEMMLADLNAWL